MAAAQQQQQQQQQTWAADKKGDGQKTFPLSLSLSLSIVQGKEI